MNPKEIKELIELLSERRIAEFEMEGPGLKLRIRTSSLSGMESVEIAAASAPLQPPPSSPPPSPPVAPVAPPAPSQPSVATVKTHVIKAPIVGTFYRSSSPATKTYVEIGSRVQPGGVLCIIEAMKLMNEIESDVSGEVIEIHQENAKPVEYGQALFTIKLD